MSTQAQHTELRGARLALFALLALALALRVAAALRKSLVLDEFHTWFHATRPSVQAFFATLELDNHPPLGFAVVAVARALFGASELALRTPALLFGLVELALLFVLARRLSGPRVALAATALLALSSLHVDFSSQARMYALHSLAASATLFALVRLLEAPPSRAAQIALALSLATAFHTHYFGAQYVVVYALALGLVAALDASRRPRLARLIAPVGVAALLCAPWALTGFAEQLSHALPPGGDRHSPVELGEAFVHLFFLNVRLGGDGWREAFIAGGGVVLLVAARGAWRLLRDPAQRCAGVLCAAGAFGAPLFAWLLALALPRAGFNWHYVLPSALPMALLAAAGARGLLRYLFGGALALAALLTGLNLATRGTEDFRGAVARALELNRPGDALISVEWQPALFPQGQPYDYYAPRLVDAPPPRLPLEHFTLPDPRVLDGVQRVIVVRKSLPPGQHLAQLLEARFVRVQQESFGFDLDVSVWERR
jgi:hypothetical protein